jgi:cell division initiation protein
LRLTPLDVKKQEFKRAMRGYDSDEVNTFLEMVAEEFETLQREKKRLEEENLKLRTQLRDYQEVERTLKQTLMNVQETVQVSRENSQREADIVVREAELHADKIIEEARLKLAQLKNELLLVRAQKESFARRLRHLLESQLELIGVLEMDDLGFGESDHRAAEPAAAPKEKDRYGKHLPPGRPQNQETVLADSRNSTMPRREEMKAAETPAGAGHRESIKMKPLDTQEDKKEPKISDHFIT